MSQYSSCSWWSCDQNRTYSALWIGIHLTTKFIAVEKTVLQCGLAQLTVTGFSKKITSQYLLYIILETCRSQWPRGLRRRFSAARLLRVGARIPAEAWTLFCCDCCVLPGKGLRRIDHSPRGVLPTVARRFVWSRNLEHEEAKGRYWAE
jgi:hypothetical protein